MPEYYERSLNGTIFHPSSYKLPPPLFTAGWVFICLVLPIPPLFFIKQLTRLRDFVVFGYLFPFPPSAVPIRPVCLPPFSFLPVFFHYTIGKKGFFSFLGLRRVSFFYERCPVRLS